MKKNLLKTMLVGVMTLMATGVSAEEWDVVWSADFSSAPQGMTYSVSNGSVDISTGVLFYHQGGGSGNRAINTAFTDKAFAVESNWQMEFDWGASSSNQNPSNVAFATNNGTAFTITWDKYATAVTITDANSTELTSTLPIDGYNKSTMTVLSHFTITGNTENGIYLTVTNGETTYVDNVLVSSTFGYPATFNGSLGRAVSHMALDNIVFKTPAVAGFVAAPTAILTGVNGANRIFELSTLTADATIYWSETAPEDDDYSSWASYSEPISTSADPIYAIAIKGTDKSEVSTIETGAGEAIALNAPVIGIDNLVLNGEVLNPVFNATDNQSAILLAPSTTLTATFNGTAIELPYTATTDGTLSITASAEGYTDATTELAVKGEYKQKWLSTDYSKLAEDDIITVLGEGWEKMEETSRWASWTAAKEPYTYYRASGEGVFNVTVEENLRMRNVCILNLGYGFGRNITGGEPVSFLNTNPGTIAGIKYYTGYGADVDDFSINTIYQINIDDLMPVFNTNNGHVLVQVSYYNPVGSDIVDAIKGVAVQTESNAVYNLAGQRVMRSAEGKNAQKGLYIVNGKKVVKK